MSRRRPAPPCGTPAAYTRHCRYREAVDEACRAAHSAAMTECRVNRGETARTNELVNLPEDSRQDAARLVRRHTEGEAECADLLAMLGLAVVETAGVGG